MFPVALIRSLQDYPLSIFVAILASVGVAIILMALTRANRELRAARAARAASAAPARPLVGRFVVTCYALRGETATGRRVSTDVVAVDPRVVPLGARLYIAGVGVRTAADTGRAIKGSRLDIWMPTSRECRQFGRRPLAVYRA